VFYNTASDVKPIGSSAIWATPHASEAAAFAFTLEGYIMTCSSCGQTVADGASFCNSCGAAASSPVATGAGTTVAPTTKACPYCGEQILQTAIRCRFCSSDLTAPRQQQGGVVVTGPPMGRRNLPLSFRMFRHPNRDNRPSYLMRSRVRALPCCCPLSFQVVVNSTMGTLAKAFSSCALSG